ncbi:MAG: S53 family peptidase [Edaphobacter sp.]|uniref:S53 family peptidase n=1 Tax=Edaphobacter sp. TaxID=1934404 RepID=UPI00239F7E46|nr:S53 family peptidase [Edaphobacter sp.]MDE1176753.1 S53 family peptidase [Edaphobacter sp.]
MSFAKRPLLVFAALLFAAMLPTPNSYAAEKATLTQRVASTQTVSFDVFLPLQDRAALGTLVDGLNDSTSASYHKWLKPEEFKARFAPTDASVAAVRKQLEAYGLTTEMASSQRIHVTGNASAVEQVFATQLKVGTFRNGRKTIAAATPISMPGVLVTNKAVVGGLSGFIRMRAHSRRLATPVNRYSTAGPYWFTDLKQAYAYPSYKVYTGKGVTIGVLMSNDFNAADMTAYFTHEKLAVPKMSTVSINGGAPYDPDGSTETHLDMQQTGGMAPNAKIVLYNLPDLSDDNIIDGLMKILDDNKADVVNMSFGGAELFYTPEYNDGEDFTEMLGIYDDLFKQGNAQGITFVASSGDQGALPAPPLGCFDTDATAACGSMQPSAETPASSPHVTGVGGTNLETTLSATTLDSKYVGESAYGDPLLGDIFYGTPATGNIWGSGGGDSIYYKKPLFQALVNTGSKYRTVPDVAGHMGGCPVGAVEPCPASDSAVVVAIDGGLYGVIGTSASAPDFAGLLALKVERYGRRLGNENPEIYALAALQNLGFPLKVYHDTISGYNGLYTSKKGYSRVLGNGTVIGVNFLLAPLVPTAGTPQTPSNP